MDHWQYLLVLAACLAITAAVLPVAAVFVAWDAIAVAADIWTYNPRYVTGWELPGRLPIEELLFFVVIPLCGLLTYNAVDAILARLRRVRTRAEVPRS